ncbi:hypothetical protein PI124_g15786 [Phytophthora idaei]|nr:hypothetical protein PI126_g18434 [Phytophthora idaei]KAG3239279.1 hypothetical protein PI124_g15786 [Phytophthora idaei]
MAVADMRAEVMGMAAATVQKWVIYGTATHHIVGDILFAPSTKGAAGLASTVYLTPNTGVTAVGVIVGNPPFGQQGRTYLQNAADGPLSLTEMTW